MKIVLLVLSSVAQGVVMPVNFPVERPVMGATLELVAEGAPSERDSAYRLVLNRRATEPLATSFTLLQQRVGVRCLGRCLPVVDKFRVVSAAKDGCGVVTYRALNEKHAQIFDEEPDIDGHQSDELLVVDQVGNECSRLESGWLIEHTSEQSIRQFVGKPEVYYAIQ